MTRLPWPLGCVAAFLIFVSAVPAAAQTLIFRSAPPAATVEATFQGTTLGTATVSPIGEATIEVATFPSSEPEIVAAIHTDLCGSTLRVQLVSRTIEAAPAVVGCERRSVPGYFVIRANTTLVIDIATSVPTVRIRQGDPPADWLRYGSGPTGRQAPVGLLAFFGAGFGDVPDSIELLCGNANGCLRETTKLSFAGGVGFWLTRFLGAEVGLLKPLALSAVDNIPGDFFTSTFSPRTLTVAGLAGLSFGPVRFYGRFGANYHRATFRTDQTIDGTTATADGVTQVFPTVTQTFEYDTVGWGSLYGGGIEGWVSNRAALFADFSFIHLKGENADDGGERTTDDRARAFIAGLKIQLLGDR